DLILILQHLNFPDTLQNAIRTTYHHCNTQMFINGQLGRMFPVAKGVPQGDPFAPILFNLSVEPLFNSLHEHLQGILTPGGTIKVRAYADDTYIFGNDTQDWKTLSDILETYEQSSGALVNWSKSSIVPLTDNHPPLPDTPTS